MSVERFVGWVEAKRVLYALAETHQPSTERLMMGFAITRLGHVIRSTHPTIPLPLQERVLAPAWRGARWEGRCEIVNHDLAVGALEFGHAVPLCHEIQRIFPLRTRLSLRGDQLEA